MIREPEISRPDRELAAREAFQVLYPHENWNDLDERYDVRGGYHPMQIKAFEVADAILNLASPVAKGASQDAELSDEFDRPGRLSDATRHSAEGTADPALSGTRGVVTPVGGRGEEGSARADLSPASRSPEPAPHWINGRRFSEHAGERWRHVKRGSVYSLPFGRAEAMVQCAEPITDESVLTIYIGEDGMIFARPTHEFHDGRFEPLPPPPQEQWGMK